MDTLLAQFAGIFFPRIAQVFDIAGPVEIGPEFLLRFDDIDAVIEPQLVFDPGDGGVDDEALFLARDLLFEQVGDGGMARCGDQAEADGGGKSDKLHRGSPFSVSPGMKAAG